ncbi:MAG: hypothetical protein KDC94_06430 [Aequorivita sp.]|nr:hypothetical protein [Aequorivita sp.]
MTLTTVGYGHLFPTSDISKIFTASCVITGIGSIYSFINIFFYEYRVEKIKKQKKSTKKGKAKPLAISLMFFLSHKSFRSFRVPF